MKRLFLTSVVGSLPRPAFVLDLINQRPPLPQAQYEQRMEAAVRYAVAMQEQAGLDVVTDGEWGRKSYIGVIAELAHGFELGNLPDGRPFQNFDEYKNLLLSDKDQLARALADKLLTYATGTPLTTADRPKVEAIVESVRSKNYGFRSLVHEVVQSELFLHK